MSTPTLLDAMSTVTEPLEEAGIRWTTDFQKLNAPCVYLPIPVLSFRFGKDAVDVSFSPVAVVQNTGNRAAIESLSDLIVRVQEALGFSPTTARPVDVTTADQTGVLLGAELPFTLSIRSSEEGV
jgi:hypothetical protein